MSKKTDAWMPLWIGDYLADTQHLTRDEHGAYLLMLMTYWRNGGPLPDDDRRLAAIVKASPKEWKALRPVMAEFFNVANGVWTQKRVDSELMDSAERSEKAASRAKKAAEARWKQSQKDASSNAPSIPQALHEECPSPSPSPITSKEGVLSLSPGGGGTGSDPPPGTEYGRICLAMKAAGIADTSPGNPEFRTLVDAGADVAEFLSAAQEAAGRGKGFRYAVSCVASGRKRAAELATQIHRGELPVAETAYQRSMRERMNEFAPSAARKAPGRKAGRVPSDVEFFDAVEVPARRLESAP